MALDPQEGLNASRQASARRAAMLLRLSRLADMDGRQCLPTLIKACQCDTAMLAMRVWRVDQAVFGTGRTAALRHVRLAAQWCGHDLESPGKATVGWLLDERTGGARLAAWLYAIALDNGFRPSGPNPYHAHANRAAAVPSTHHTSQRNTP